MLFFTFHFKSLYAFATSCGNFNHEIVSLFEDKIFID